MKLYSEVNLANDTELNDTNNKELNQNVNTYDELKNLQVFQRKCLRKVLTGGKT